MTDIAPRQESKAYLLEGQALSGSYRPPTAGFRSREGYVTSSTRGIHNPSKMYRPDSVWTWFFVGIVFVQAAIVLSLESYVFARFERSLSPGSFSNIFVQSNTRTIPTFLTLYIFGIVYQVILVWDALRLKNTIQVIGLCVYNLAIFVYSIVQIGELSRAVSNLRKTNQSDLLVWDGIHSPLVAIPCILGFGTVSLSGVAWKLYDEFAWTIYKHISADLQMKRRYLTFQIYITLLKFDFFFFLGFTIQFLVIVVDNKSAEFGLTVAAIPVTIIILLLASYWTRKENRIGMGAIIFFYFAALAYFLYKLNSMYNGIHAATYAAARTSLTTFAVITVLLILSTITIAVKCTQNFDKGLKPHLSSRVLESEEEKGHITEMPNLAEGPVPSRMTID